MTAIEWTEEQRQNAMKYGVCLMCRSPREARFAIACGFGVVVAKSELVCPNGCDR